MVKDLGISLKSNWKRFPMMGSGKGPEGSFHLLYIYFQMKARSRLTIHTSRATVMPRAGMAPVGGLADLWGLLWKDKAFITHP